MHKMSDELSLPIGNLPGNGYQVGEKSSLSYNHAMDRLPQFAVVSLLAMARRFMRVEPSQILGKDDKDPYLLRWWLEKDVTLGSVYLHHMLRSDAEAEMHDHPSDNLTIMLDGEMNEHTEKGLIVRRPGDIVARRAEQRHRIELSAPIITMWVMGPKIREWGFWREQDGQDVFIHNQDFFRERGYF